MLEQAACSRRARAVRRGPRRRVKRGRRLNCPRPKPTRQQPKGGNSGNELNPNPQFPISDLAFLISSPNPPLRYFFHLLPSGCGAGSTGHWARPQGLRRRRAGAAAPARGGCGAQRRRGRRQAGRRAAAQGQEAARSPQAHRATEVLRAYRVREMATAAATAKEVDKKVELMKEVRAHEVAIGELNNLPPSRAVYQKGCNIFFRKSVKSAVTSEQKQLDLAKARLQKLDQA